jgi:hypothetical protein
LTRKRRVFVRFRAPLNSVSLHRHSFAQFFGSLCGKRDNSGRWAMMFHYAMKLNQHHRWLEIVTEHFHLDNITIEIWYWGWSPWLHHMILGSICSLEATSEGTVPPQIAHGQLLGDLNLGGPGNWTISGKTFMESFLMKAEGRYFFVSDEFYSDWGKWKGQK